MSLTIALAQHLEYNGTVATVPYSEVRMPRKKRVNRQGMTLRESTLVDALALAMAALSDVNCDVGTSMERQAAISRLDRLMQEIVAREGQPAGEDEFYRELLTKVDELRRMIEAHSTKGES